VSKFKDIEVKLFKDFCENTVAITTEQWSAKFREFLQPKVYEILIGASEDKQEEVKKAIYAALDEVQKWEYEVDSFEGYLLKKGITSNE